MPSPSLEPGYNLFVLGRILLGIWFTALGSSAGSFLNVVIYRWPNRRSVVSPGSRCPHCGHAVRWFDNIPILNWFWLRGRCRDCQTPIPFRYPAVEMVVAGLFLGLYLLYVVNLGDNLPRGWERRFARELMHLLVPLLAYQAVFFTILVGSTLIRYDGHPVPPELIACAVTCGLIGVSVLPFVHPVPVLAGPMPGGWELPAKYNGLASGLCGLVAGLLLGVLANLPSLGRPRPERHLATAGFELATCGLFLGWQAAVAIGTLTLTVNLFQQAVRGRLAWLRFLPIAAWVLAWSVAYVLCWGALTRAWPALRGVLF